jgi:replicative DNA helicase
MLTYRSAPHHIEAEQSLLGAILVNNDAFYRGSDFGAEALLLADSSDHLRDRPSLIRVGKVATPVTLKTFVPA